MSTTYDVKVHRDGRWWMVEIPAIGGLTQARRLGDVQEMARSFISVDQDLRPSAVVLGRIEIEAAGHSLTSTRAKIDELRRRARQAEEEVAALMLETARDLADADVPLRDIGAVLDLSHQRVHQLLHDTRASA
jgi:hypothetical protein